MVYNRASASDYDAWETIFGNKGWGSDKLIPLLKKVMSLFILSRLEYRTLFSGRNLSRNNHKRHAWNLRTHQSLLFEGIQQCWIQFLGSGGSIRQKSSFDGRHQFLHILRSVWRRYQLYAEFYILIKRSFLRDGRGMF